MNIVAIDPAAVRFAYAVFVGDRLRACGYGETPADVLRRLPPERFVWVAETPQNYARFGVAHKDLDRLRATLATLEAEAKRRGDVWEEVRPFGWKANVPKHVHHSRLWDRVLDAKEHLLLPDRPRRDGKYQHDVHDAVALGATRAGRMSRGRTVGR